MLKHILQLLSERGALSLQQIALAAQIDSSALEPMLELLLQKKKIYRIDPPCLGKCGGTCTNPHTMVLYAITKK